MRLSFIVHGWRQCANDNSTYLIKLSLFVQRPIAQTAEQWFGDHVTYCCWTTFDCLVLNRNYDEMEHDEKYSVCCPCWINL